MKRILVICTCNKYWKRFAACRASWMKAMAEASTGEMRSYYHFAVAVLGTEQPYVPPFEVYSIPVETCTGMGSTIESKSLMIRYILVRTAGFAPTHYMFTDADIIVPPTVVQSLQDAPEDAYLVADRIDLNDLETAAWIVGEGPVPDRTPNPKKRGMGWFQVLPRQVFWEMNSSLPWGHAGYDLFDWKINDLALKSGLTQYVVPGSFLHLRHGNDGANWKGTTSEW